MNKKIRVLLITDEVWNDEMHGNNVLSNWFDGFNAEFANVYCSPGEPNNNCCARYFQVTDKMMISSLFGGKRAGIAFVHEPKASKQTHHLVEPEHKRLYAFLKSISTEGMRALRELVWISGRYDEIKLRNFIEDFKPEIIFSPRKASLKILRLEKIIKQITHKPMVAFTGDDEYFLRQLQFSPIYWLSRFAIRCALKRNIKLYSLYYTHSEEQGKEYHKLFGVRTKRLLKCSDFSVTFPQKKIHTPIKLIYAGKLYCNRWKTLVKVAEVLKILNVDSVKMVLEVYTQDPLTKKQSILLDDRKNTYFKGSVSSNELKMIYQEADIALHVESFDLKNRLLTKHSFSTKIIDCLSSSCAVLAICWKEHAGYKFLQAEHAAFCVDNYEELFSVLQQICNNQELVLEYASKAWNCGYLNNNRKDIQTHLYDDFTGIIGVQSNDSLLGECRKGS